MLASVSVSDPGVGTALEELSASMLSKKSRELSSRGVGGNKGGNKDEYGGRGNGRLTKGWKVEASTFSSEFEASKFPLYQSSYTGPESPLSIASL